jgi:phenylacetyl-CoA:acceptor oxidoreductase
MWERAVRAAGGEPGRLPVLGHHHQEHAYSSGNNVGIPLMNEVAHNVRGHGRVIMNTGAAAKLGLASGDWVEVSSTHGARAAASRWCRAAGPTPSSSPGSSSTGRRPMRRT